MNFLLFSAISGAILVATPLYFVRKFRREWKMPKGMFLKAGLALLTIELFHFSVMDSAIATWPQFLDLHFVWQAIILGLSAGLFFELGRFFVLDKLFQKVRDVKRALYFALSWNGLETILFGALMVIGSYGIYLLATTSDITLLFPDASLSELDQAKLYQEQAFELFGMFPLYGLTPLLERAVLLLLDLVLTLLVLMRFQKGENRFVWFAVLGRTVFTALLFASQQFDPLVSIAVLVVLGVGLFFGLKFLRDASR